MMTKMVSVACAFAALAASAVSDIAVIARQNWPWDTKVVIDVTMPVGMTDLALVASFDYDGAHHELALADGAVITGVSGLPASSYCMTGGTYRIIWDPAASGYAGAIEGLSISAKSYTRDDRAWLVIDIPTGAYEYVALGDEPKDTNGKPWQGDAYKKAKMVFRRIPAGTFIRGYTDAEKKYIEGLDTSRGLGTATMLTAASTTLTSDYYMSIFQTTKAQVSRIVDASSTSGDVNPDAGNVLASGFVCFQRGSNSVEGINWPITKFAVTPGSIVGRFRERCGNKFWIDLPTCAQWQHAARPDTSWLWYDTSSYPGGMTGGVVGDSIDTITNIINKISVCYGKWASNSSTWSPPSSPGLYLPNSYGLYDLVGSRRDLILDIWNGNASASDSAGIDPVGTSSPNNNNRMACNGYANGGRITSWSIGYASTIKSDDVHNSSNEMCYRYAIHLRPPQSFVGRWMNE